nr:MauE/DoxX family redox-associated membrane protein [uncultured Desulfobacter sp.]
MKILSWIYVLCRWVLGTVFIYAGSTKLIEPEIFATLIDAYGIVPEIMLLPVAVLLPLFEVMAGIGILLDIRGSLTAISGLLILFLLILGYGMAMGLDVDCGCFSPGDPEAKAFHGLREAFYRDLLMVLQVVFAFGWRKWNNIQPKSIVQYLQFFKIKKTRENLL